MAPIGPLLQGSRARSSADIGTGAGSPRSRRARSWRSPHFGLSCCVTLPHARSDDMNCRLSHTYVHVRSPLGFLFVRPKDHPGFTFTPRSTMYPRRRMKNHFQLQFMLDKLAWAKRPIRQARKPRTIHRHRTKIAGRGVRSPSFISCLGYSGTS